MFNRTHVAIGLAALILAGFATRAAAQGRVVEITGNDQMKFNVTSITAKPGETLTVKLTNVGKLPKAVMGHNFVLLVKGADASAFATAAATARETEYIPPAEKGKILAATKLVGPGETAEVTFKVPTAPGQYEYLCSFPGHYLAGMKGVLVVK
ncbi:MAG TPA: plastocyanin/azurin family copper-binding protein [Gemmatimonadales bacterium]